MFSLSLSAQTGTIKGKIVDAKTNEPLTGASVMIVGTTSGAAADLDGYFLIRNVKAGSYTLSASYVAYLPQTKTNVSVKEGEEVELNFLLEPESYSLQEVEVVAKANRESENILLLEQKRALVATQAVGAKEMSRKGVSNAEAAVAQVSGISKQEGVKNVFVRGLGDRYNTTLLNGFPIPSEDPEYKNIALEFFGSEIIQHIGVNKVFRGSTIGDVGGAVIDIQSKELFGDQALQVNASGGFHAKLLSHDFLQQDGSSYLGFADTKQPAERTFNFPNSLDPKTIKTPFNHSYGISGGKSFRLGEARNPLSFFIVASNAVNHSYSKATERNMIDKGTISQEMAGDRYTKDISQLVLANVDYGINRLHSLSYHFMMLHANNQYVREYTGKNVYKYEDSNDERMGFLRRQQANDNLLLTHQLISDWTVSPAIDLNVGFAYNKIKGTEPDRRENNLSRQREGENIWYDFTSGDSQSRFFSELKEDDYNVKAALTYKLDQSPEGINALSVGYNGRFVKDRFEAIEYNYQQLQNKHYQLESLIMSNEFNQANYEKGLFGMRDVYQNTYQVTKYIHSGYLEGTFRLSSQLTANAGMKLDNVDLTVKQNQDINAEKGKLKKTYYLPSLNLKYELNSKHSLRLGLSKTYTLPQSKEISPYLYVNVSYSSQGNPKLIPSDNYNADLKWEFYPSSSELISLTGFYKIVKNPIGRVDIGNSARLLTYDNIGNSANVVGVEMELRKNLFNQTNAAGSKINRLSYGLNASYIHTKVELNILNTTKRDSELEGAAPVIINSDLSYSYINQGKELTTSFVLNYFSDRIHTLGTRGLNDTMEEAVATFDFVTSYKVNRNLTLKLKVMNMLNPYYRLTRESNDKSQNVTLIEYKDGTSFSLGVSYDL